MAETFGGSRWFKEGYLDNRTAGLVVGRLTFAVTGLVDVCLKGDFQSDIAGQVISLHNSQFSDDAVAAHRLVDFAIPQLGTVSLISFDPHPLLDPHPYLEWFSLEQDHYRIELAEGDAWVVESDKAQAFDDMSRRLRENFATQIAVSTVDSTVDLNMAEQEWF